MTTRSNNKKMPLGAALVASLMALGAAAGCGGSGMGKAVRQDITERMASTQPTLSSCYEKALKEHRRLHGKIVVKFQAAAGTGKFTNVRVIHNQLLDKEVEACVVSAVSALSLARPQKTVVSVEYPINFSPSSP